MQLLTITTALTPYMLTWASYRKNLFQDASLINMRWFSWGGGGGVVNLYTKYLQQNT
jgi:hypothetical protein